MTVLVGVSPARRSAAVVQYGELLARSLGRRLVIAAITPPNWSPSAPPVDAEWLNYADASAQVVLDHAAAHLSGDVEAEFVSQEALSARRGILELATEHGANIIVLGSSATGQIGRVSVGSTADALLHTSSVPIAIAPRGYRVAKGARITRITAAFNGSEASADLVVEAASLAAPPGSTVRIASFAVVPPVPITARAGVNAEEPIRDEWARRIRSAASTLLEEMSILPGVQTLAGVAIGTGESWSAAMDEVDWEPTEVLIVGSSSLGPLARVFIGSRAAKVIRHAPVPVVVVPRRRRHTHYGLRESHLRAPG